MEKLPLVYMNMPKAACTTIKNLMFYLEYGHFLENPLSIHKQIKSGKYLVNFKSPDKLRELIGKKKMAFTFVRDPLARAYSCFIEKIYYKSPFSFGRVRSWLQNNYLMRLPANPETIAPEKDYDAGLHRDNFMRFLAFIEDNLSGKTPIRKDPHWLPQKVIMDSFSGNITLDFVGRVENFAYDMSYIFDVLKIDDRMPIEKRFNEGPLPPYSLNEIADTDIKSMVRRIFEIDYRAFGSFQR